MNNDNEETINAPIRLHGTPYEKLGFFLSDFSFSDEPEFGEDSFLSYNITMSENSDDDFLKDEGFMSAVEDFIKNLLKEFIEEVKIKE
jgi:hypothetical protein